jgi:hypothetical protein
MLTRLFKLERLPTGISGTSYIAEGVRFADGTVALRWRTKHRSTCIYDSMVDVIAIHGYDGRTIVSWCDEHGEESAEPLPGEVPSSQCSEMEIVFARAEGRLRVTERGLGFVLRPKAPSHPR